MYPDKVLSRQSKINRKRVQRARTRSLTAIGSEVLISVRISHIPLFYFAIPSLL